MMKRTELTRQSILARNRGEASRVAKASPARTGAMTSTMTLREPLPGVEAADQAPVPDLHLGGVDQQAAARVSRSARK